jgi:hypothetical protein
MWTPIEDASPARAIAIRKLAVDAMTCEALRAFTADGVESILLKGITLQDALYGGERTRGYGDADLLVPRAGLPRARAALSRIGFRRPLDPLDETFRVADPHSEDWRRGGDAIDLHWRFPGIGAPPERVWAELARRTRPIRLGDESAAALEPDGTALLLALHAAHHGARTRKPMEDLRRGVARLDRETWSRAVALAGELDALDPFSAGLRAVPAGAALASELRLPEPSSRRVLLKAGDNPPTAPALLTLLETPWRAGKARAAIDALIPSPEFMRAHYPVARRGPGGLALAYVRRGLARARQLPAAAAAVARTRRI